jgi:dopamine receptor D1
VEATCTLIIGVTSLFVTVCPIFILLLTIIICQFVFSDGELAECRNLTWLMTYFKELGSVHAVYSPLIFLMRNKELRVSLFG